MTVSRYYSSTAASTTLTGGIGSGATSIVVASVSGFPVSYPYTLIIDRTGTKEAIKVTGAAGTTLTVVRGQDGTSAVAHNNGDAIEHGATAQDFREPQEHIAASTDVHGLSGGASVVGTSSSQTLTNKTLTTPTIGSFANATHTHANAAGGGTVAHSALTGLTSGDPHTQYQQESEKAQASGYASLDGTTKVPIAQVPTGVTSTTVALGNHSHDYYQDTDAGGHVAANGTKQGCEITGILNPSGASGKFLAFFRFNGFQPDSAVNLRVVWSINTATPSGAGYVGLATALGTTAGTGQAVDTGAFGGMHLLTPGNVADFDVRLSATNGSADGNTIDNSELVVIRLV